MSYTSAAQAALICATIIVFIVAITFNPFIPTFIGGVSALALTTSIR